MTMTWEELFRTAQVERIAISLRATDCLVVDVDFTTDHKRKTSKAHLRLYEEGRDREEALSLLIDTPEVDALTKTLQTARDLEAHLWAAFRQTHEDKS